MANLIDKLKELTGKNASRVQTAQKIAKRMKEQAEAAKEAAKG